MEEEESAEGLRGSFQKERREVGEKLGGQAGKAWELPGRRRGEVGGEEN